MNTITFIPISYETDDVSVSFHIEFGKGKDDCKDQKIRTTYKEPYNIEEHNNGDDNIMYRLLAEEGAIVLNISNVIVKSKKNLYKKNAENGFYMYNYGITAVMDLNEKPVYYSSTSFHPSNDGERDGVPWIIQNGKTLNVDQNASGEFQWTTARALEYGVKPTKEQEEKGVEERHENTGMIYITFHAIYSEEFTEIEKVSRGISRGFGSVAARVGYGNQVKTNSVSKNVVAIPNSRFILPIRLRITGDDVNPDIKCAKNLKTAMYVEELQRKMSTAFPDD